MWQGRREKEARRHSVLEHIVHMYIYTASPVSSKAISERMGKSVSSATIRNIMAQLEDEGYIEQPHTSAGRIPTQRGYRCYVDMVKEHILFKKKEAEELAGEYDLRIRTIKEVIERTSLLLSQKLHNVSIVMWPNIKDFYLKHMELVKLKAETVLAVLVTVTNAVKNYVIKLDNDLEKAELEKIANYINRNFEYSPLSEVSEKLKHTALDAQDEKAVFIKTARYALSIVDSIIDKKIEDEIYWEGLDYFLEGQRSFDVSMTRRLIKIFSDKRTLIDLLRQDLSFKGLKIHIGMENKNEMMTDCSIVTSGYNLHGRPVGRLGVIGPMRMDYDRAMWMVTCLSDIISRKLESISD